MIIVIIIVISIVIVSSIVVIYTVHVELHLHLFAQLFDYLFVHAAESCGLLKRFGSAKSDDAGGRHHKNQQQTPGFLEDDLRVRLPVKYGYSEVANEWLCNG